MGGPLLTEEPYASTGSVPVYDADAHIAEPPSVWQEYTDPKFRELVMQCRPVGELDSIFVEDEGIGMSCAPASIPNAYGTEVTWDDIVPGSYDPAERLKVMDAEGLDAAVMFPSLHLLSGDIGYNRWMADFVSENPNRLFGVGVTPLQSVDHAVAEIAACAEAGLMGVTFRPERYNGLELFSKEMFLCASLT